MDVARRVAGTGSLGVDRYVILVEGKGSPNSNYLLDLKHALPSALANNCKVHQPKWDSDAQRVVAIQRRMQAVSMAFLTPVKMQGKSYILRALQQSEDRVSLNRNVHSGQQVQHAIATLGSIVANAHLRSSGRDNSAIADALIAYGHKRKWKIKLIKAAQICAQQVQEDWATYCTAYDAGAFDI